MVDPFTKGLPDRYVLFEFATQYITVILFRT